MFLNCCYSSIVYKTFWNLYIKIVVQMPFDSEKCVFQLGGIRIKMNSENRLANDRLCYRTIFVLFYWGTVVYSNRLHYNLNTWTKTLVRLQIDTASGYRVNQSVVVSILYCTRIVSDANTLTSNRAFGRRSEIETFEIRYKQKIAMVRQRRYSLRAWQSDFVRDISTLLCFSTVFFCVAAQHFRRLRFSVAN